MDYQFKKIREELELKQYEVAHLIGISRGNYANIEAEILNIKLKYLLTYCNKLNYSMDYVCNLTDINRNPEIFIKSIDKNIMSDRLTIIEIEQNITSKKIADELGVDKNTYCQYKSPKYTNIIQTLMLKRIASKHGYSMDWIVGRSNQKYIATSDKYKK